jgi:5'-nucleotidase
MTPGRSIGPRRGLLSLVLAGGIVGLAPLSGGACAGQDVSAWPARVLMTNDDGIDTPGIRALAAELARTSDVYVVAPEGNRSGSGGFISMISRPMTVVEVPDSTLAGVWSVDGFPADAILWGVRTLFTDAPPDLVISGINDSPNASDAWLVSGTIGAARTAAFLGIPALAVSGYDPEDSVSVRQAAEWVARLARSPLVRALEPGDYLLVNMPRQRIEDVTGVVVAPLDLAFLDPGVTPLEEAPGQWRFRWEPGSEPAAGGDVDALRHAEIVLTPLRIGETVPAGRFEALLDSIPPPGGGSR